MSEFTNRPWSIMNGNLENNKFLKRVGLVNVSSTISIEDLNLMSAAPELYEALDMLCKLDEHDVYTSQSWSEAFMAARKALAKADGKG